MTPNELSQRNKEIISLKSNMSLKDIGIKYGISGERVRQVLNKSGVAWKRLRLETIERITVNCLYCGNTFQKTVSSTKKFCTQICSGRNRKIDPELRRRNMNERAKAWYDKRKNDPSFKLAVKLRNHGISGFSYRDIKK